MNKLQSVLPQSNESYKDYMIRQERIYNMMEDANNNLIPKLREHIQGIKDLGYNVIILGDTIRLTITEF